MGYYATFDGVDQVAKNPLYTEEFVCALRGNVIGLPPFPTDFAGQNGDVMRPAAFSCGNNTYDSVNKRPFCEKLAAVQCPWPVANTGFRLAVVIAGLLGSAFFGVTLSSDKTKITFLKWYLGLLALLTTIACIIDSDRVGHVAARLLSDRYYFPYNTDFFLSARFIAVCVLDIVCALEAVRVWSNPL